jgi:hypothetical protein
MRKSHFNDEFLVFLGPIISRLFTFSNAEKNKKQRVLALVLSLWVVQVAEMSSLVGFSLEEEKELWFNLSMEPLLPNLLLVLVVAAAVLLKRFLKLFYSSLCKTFYSRNL